MKALHFLKFFIPFSVLLFISQQFIVTSFFKPNFFYYNTISIYIFHVLVTFISYLLLLVVNKNFKEYTGYSFMAISVLKMILSIVFLIPLIKSTHNDLIPDVAAFFIPYFLFLFFETFFAIRLINNS